MANNRLSIEIFDFYFQVYMPLLSFNQHRNGGVESSTAIKNQSRAVSRQETGTSTSKEETAKQDVVESKSKALLRDEFLINMQKFAAAITRTLQQIEGEVRTCNYFSLTTF